MTKFYVEHSQADRGPEVVEADSVDENGFEGRWLVFYRSGAQGGRSEMLRLRSENITTVRREEQHTAFRSSA